MSRLVMTLAALAAVLVSQSASAQVRNLDLALKIVQSRNENVAKLKDFTWTCRTELYENGSIEDNRIEQISHGAGGLVQRDLLNDKHARIPFGPIRHIAAEQKLQQAEDLEDGLRTLLEKYTLSTTGKVIDFMSAASVEFVSTPGAPDLLRLSGSSVVSPGDTLTVWCEPASYATSRIEITTTYKGDQVTATAWYKTFPQGLTAMSMAEIKIPDKNITLQVHDYDFEPGS